MADETITTDESTETEPTEVDAATEEATEAPDVGESLQQMNERLASFEDRLPQEEAPDILGALSGMEYEDEGQDDGQQYEDQHSDQQEPEEGAEMLRQLVREEAQEIVNQRDMVHEGQRREEAIRAMAEKHARIREPEVLNEISSRLAELGLQPQGFPPDPRHVEMVYKAFEAEAAASAEGSPAEAASDSGATLETGAGPGAPPPEVDPQTQAWLDVIQGQQSQDAFSR